MEKRDFYEEFRETQEKEPGTSMLAYIFAGYIQKRMRDEFDKKREIFWITVNPKPDVSLIEFKRVIFRLMDRVFMKGATFAFEQRASEEPYSGAHCHIMVDKLMSPKQMHNRIFNTVKQCVGNVKHVDLRAYPYSFREEKLDYLKGNKWDTEKDAVVAATYNWREVNNLEDIYVN